MKQSETKKIQTKKISKIVRLRGIYRKVGAKVPGRLGKPFENLGLKYQRSYRAPIVDVWTLQKLPSTK